MRRSVVAGSLAAAGVAAVAACVEAVRRERAQIVAGLTPPGEVREIDGERLHFIDQGSGPAVVLIHGFGASGFSWREIIGDLAGSRRVIVPDLPGFGFSERRPVWPLTLQQHARRIARLMDELGIERAAVVGHSMGGGVAARLAIQFPGKVDRLVFVASIDPGEEQWASGAHLVGPALFVTGLGLAIPAATRAASRLAVRSMVWDREYATEEVIHGYCDPLLIPGTGACLRKLAVDTREEPPADLSGVSVPALVISGASDRGIPPATGERIAAAIPGARHIIIENAGHLIPEEQPDVFLGHLRPFLAEAEAETGAPAPRRNRKRAAATPLN